MSDRTLILTPALALKLWRDASREEVGLRIPIALKDLEKIKPLMYKVRKEAGDPALASLMLCVAPGGTEIWLVKKTLEAP